MRRNGITLQEVLLLCVIFGGLALIFLPTGHRSHLNRDRAYCQSNLKQIALAMTQYRQDSNGYFPSLRTIIGWREAISPYLKSAEVFHCPSVGSDKTPPSCDYWFNAHLSEVKADSLSLSANTFLLGDGYSSADPRVALSHLPQSWRDDDLSPSWRHLTGANYAFAAGHVKWLKIGNVPVKAPNGLIYTFAVP